MNRSLWRMQQPLFEESYRKAPFDFPQTSNQYSARETFKRLSHSQISVAITFFLQFSSLQNSDKEYFFLIPCGKQPCGWGLFFQGKSTREKELSPLSFLGFPMENGFLCSIFITKITGGKTTHSHAPHVLVISYFSFSISPLKFLLTCSSNTYNEFLALLHYVYFTCHHSYLLIFQTH